MECMCVCMWVQLLGSECKGVQTQLGVKLAFLKVVYECGGNVLKRVSGGRSCGTER